MKRAVAAFLCFAAGAAFAASDYDDLFGAAWRAETVSRDLPAAILLYERAAESDPLRAPRARFRRALCLETQGLDEAAIEAYGEVERASEDDPAMADAARWRRRRLELERPVPPVPSTPTVAGLTRLVGPRWEARLGSGVGFLLPRRTYTLNDTTYASSGFAARHPVVEWGVAYRTASWMSVGLEGVEFLSVETRAVAAIDDDPAAAVRQHVENRASYVGPVATAHRRRGRWTLSVGAGFGSCVQRSRIEVFPVGGGTPRTLRGRTSDVAVALTAGVDVRPSRRLAVGFHLRDFAVFLREYNDGRAAADPRARPRLRHVLLPLFRASVQL